MGSAGRLGQVRDVFDHFTMLARTTVPRRLCLVPELARPPSDENPSAAPLPSDEGLHNTKRGFELTLGSPSEM